MNVDKLQFIDLGFPSGKLWATENVKDENGKEAHFTFNDALEAFGKNLPTREDWKELFDNSTYKWNEGRKGLDVTGPNGNSIFLPAAGYRSGGVGVYLVGGLGFYWSLSVYGENSAYHVSFRSGGLNPQSYDNRCLEFSVRLIKKITENEQSYQTNQKRPCDQ